MRKELDSLQKWSSSAFAWAFMLQLPAETDAVCYDLIKGATGVVHSVVEIKDENGVITYDPAQGCAYKVSVKELIQGDCDYDSIVFWGNKPSAYFMWYQGARFFFKAREQKRTHLKDIEQR